MVDFVKWRPFWVLDLVEDLFASFCLANPKNRIRWAAVPPAVWKKRLTASVLRGLTNLSLVQSYPVSERKGKRFLCFQAPRLKGFLYWSAIRAKPIINKTAALELQQYNFYVASHRSTQSGSVAFSNSKATLKWTAKFIQRLSFSSVSASNLPNSHHFIVNYFLQEGELRTGYPAKSGA